MDQLRAATIKWMRADATLVSLSGHGSSSPRILVWDERRRDSAPLVALMASPTERLANDVDEVYLSFVTIQIQTDPASDSVGTTCDALARRLVEMVERTDSGDASYTGNADVYLQSITLDDPPTGSDTDEDLSGFWVSVLTLQVMWRRK